MLKYNENENYFKKIKEKLIEINSPYDFIIFNLNIIHTGGYI